ncbi:putative translational activator [Wickerhamomyces ciferrii]|uniref:Translational activator n=1 Tax=Wickerhamomyces ciferrii (strain ATCC 14091 / BCRC 22168 / CBS 111 / JCM 3599 / NBRC 0793 / NRRL Y-1031 F-60-10) TaxID=1206466 RepID=K0L060_WICCF|nr:putative translational activator [Wickerhamomyces ciferrii]CCH46758.1 putative translational activator [Wickerhamomyces ciferrii]
MSGESISWELLSSSLEKDLFLSSYKDRIAAFHKVESFLSQSREGQEKPITEIQSLLLRHYTNLLDNKSIELSTNILTQTFQLNKDSLPKFLQVFNKFVTKHICVAFNDLVVLSSWVNSILINFANDEILFEKIVKEIASTQLFIFESLYNQFTSEDDRHKNRIRKSILKSTRSALSALSSTQVSKYIKSATTSTSLPMGAITVLGLISKNASQLTDEDKTSVNEYYKKIVLASKTPLTNASDLAPFFNKFLSQDEFEKSLLPSLERSILRSPDLALPLTSNLLKSLPSSYDLPKYLTESKLLSQITSSYKSSKENVRELALDLYKVIIAYESTEDVLLKVADEFLKTLKSLSAAEQKALVAESLALIPIKFEKVSLKVASSLIAFVSKDQNEISLNELLTAFFKHILVPVKNGWEIPSDAKATVLKGLKDAKLQLRRLWAINLGSSIKNLEINEPLTQLITELFPALVQASEEVFSNPTNNIKGISIPYVVSVIANSIESLEGAESFISRTITETEKPSVLLNPRVYSKFTSEDEKLWFVESLFNVTKAFKESSTALGKSWITFILSKDSSPELRRLNFKLLADAYAVNQLIIGDSVISALYEALVKSSQSDEYNFNYVYSFSTRVLHALFQNSKDVIQDILIQHLSNTVIVSHHKSLVDTGFSWISLVLGSQIDPGLIVKLNHKDLVSQIADVLATNEESKLSSGIYHAAAAAASTLAFIEPSAVPLLLNDLIVDGLSSSRLNKISEQELAIYKAKEGELVINVLENKKNVVENKNTKDYETRKWEESLRKEVSKKQQATKKLTKEEQAIVNEQLSKESNIRQRIQEVQNNLYRGITIIDALSKNVELVDNGKSIWYATAVNKLLEVLSLNVTAELVGYFPIETFLNLSKAVSSKLGPLRFFLGVATLRVNEVKNPEERLSQEDLLELITRLLFRVKFLSDQQPFDYFSLIYALPLLTKVLERGKVVAIQNSKKPATKSEFVEEDKEEEQLHLAVEIIGTHAELFKNTTIPRENIINVLLSLLQLPSKAKLAKESLLTLCQHISVDYSEADLNLFLAGTLSPETFVRNTVLEALDQEFDLSDLSYSNEIWISCHDNDENNAEIAATIWEENKLSVTFDSIKSLYPFLGVADSGLRYSVARALSDAIRLTAFEKDIFRSVVEELQNLYVEKATPPEPLLDEFGLVIKTSQEQKDPWEDRNGIATTFKFIADLFVDEQLVADFINFIINKRALGDQETLVADEFKDAAIEIIDAHGAGTVETLIPVFESALSASKGTDKSEETIRENVVVLYGTLARHLSSSDARLSTIVDRLLKTLETPSERVQKAISDVIAPLVHLFKPKVGGYIEHLFKVLFEAKTNPRKRGAAYGIAGLAKGYGISSLAEFDIIRNLSDAADDKKDPKRRESVSIAFECLSSTLGKFFEPYVIEVLPIILKSLGDAVPEVRDTTTNTAKVMMQNTTGYGVKKLIPLAIENLDEISWRTKKGSVELLGSMAYLDPAQLSASLSTIVPEIVGVLNDSHKEVRKAADVSLKRFGEVIRNPEIQTLVPVLIKAIGDPTKHTEEALDALIKTQFVHYIDGPSLALIIHVIHRGMKDRSANTKRKACQIVGNMAILVDTKDLLPYLHQLISELEIAMVDPVPNTRATAARALGALVEKLGEEQFPYLIPRLLDTLSDETKAGDRLGSAQALAEVINGIGIRKLDELLPTILKGATSTRASTREGYLPLLLFIPVCFGSQFAPYITQIIPAILNGLADTDESIRGTALRAGRLIVKNYASKAIDLLLPELEKGLLDVNHRIRQSSVELTGDLLFQVTGISGKNELVEEENEFSGALNTQLVDVLGVERRDRVLALLFICRSDVSGAVRSATIDIWKSLVANTPRTVKEILPTLTNIIIRRLANRDEQQRQIAAQTLGELVRRVGGNALPQLLPTLQESVQTSDPDAKQGACIAVHELIGSSNEDSIYEYQEIFVDIIRSTLVDPSPQVRESAAQAFDIFQNTVGKVAVDEIIPYLLNLLESPNSEDALAALQEIMTTKSEVIFPILIPTLLESPIDAFRARALGSMAEVAGKALYKRLTTVINALVKELVREDVDDEAAAVLKESFDKIILSVEDDEGLHPLLQQLLALIKGDDPKKRAIIYERLSPFFSESTLDYSIYTQDLMTQSILSLDDKDPEVVKHSVVALAALTKKQPKESLERLVKPAKQALQITGVSGQDLYGFTLPKGANSILPVFSYGLMYGSSDVREVSALGIADLVSKTPVVHLRLLVTQITGPLIRVVGERFPSDVKAAILYALNVIFDKIPQYLRAFIPQLQRTFVKSLSDANNETLRLRAAKALGTLIEHQPRVDPLVSELVMGAKNAENSGVKTAMLKALLEVITKAGEKMSESSKTSILDLVEDEILEADDKLAVAYARLVGSLSRILTADEGLHILKSKVLDSKFDDGDSSKFAILTLNSFLKDAPDHIFNNGLLPQIVAALVDGTNSTSSYISDNSVLAIGKILLLQDEKAAPKAKPVSEEPFDIPFPLVSDLVKQLAITTLKPASNSLDTRRLSLTVVRTVSRQKGSIFKAQLDVIAPSVFACVRDVIIPIKLAAEKAYLALFNLVEDENMEGFNKWFQETSEKGTTVNTVIGTTVQMRSIGDYTKRVAVRLVGVERERIAAGGDEETLYSDRFEDEREIWAIGGVDLSNV